MFITWPFHLEHNLNEITQLMKYGQKVIFDMALSI